MPESMGFIQADAAQARPPPRLRLRSVVAVAVVGVAMVVASAVMVARMPAPRTDLPDVSTLVLDREGVLLRAFTVDEGRWRLPVALEGVDPTFIKLLVAYEDQGFFSHKGVDPRAVVRAGWQALRAGRVVSGASTLTMQTVRLITGARERTVLRKVRELVDALKLEQALSKDEILLRYLHLAPYGGNIEGVRAASLAYFGREPDLLTLAQAALLVALPQAPESRRPDRFPLAAERARARVLDQLVARGAISPSAAQRAKRESIPTGRRAVPRLAPHVARRLVSEHPERRIHTTTLRHGWQVALEELAARRVLHIGPRVSAAIVVMEQATGRLLASVGAARFLDPARAGHVDMTRAVRSPGSTLKPAIYGLGIDAGLVARGTLMEDAPQSFAGYEPDNFDDAFRGTVTVEEALQRSLNIPAMTLLDAIGPMQLFVQLRAGGVELVLPDGTAPTLALGLGGAGTTLLDLAALYGAISSDGTPVHPHVGDKRPASSPILSARAASDIAAILDGMRPPKNAARGQIAYKTGTSYGHRDAWAVGFDQQHVVAVWVGRPDGTPVPQLTGWTDAAPMLFDAFARIGVVPRRAPSGRRDRDALPPPLQRFPPRPGGGAPADGSSLKFAFPLEGSVVQLTRPDGGRVTLLARILGGAADLWLVNGRPLVGAAHRRQAQIELETGAHTLTVVTAEGDSARVQFSVE